MSVDRPALVGYLRTDLLVVDHPWNRGTVKNEKLSTAS
jgi:hypothetical protein